MDDFDTARVLDRDSRERLIDIWARLREPDGGSYASYRKEEGPLDADRAGEAGVLARLFGSIR
jgi:hypothetical protein